MYVCHVCDAIKMMMMTMMMWMMMMWMMMMKMMIAGAAAWSRGSIQRLESRADSVLVHAVPPGSADAPPLDDRDALAELERGTHELTRFSTLPVR